MVLACHGSFDLCASMLCAEEQHSWTCISEVTEPAPQYTPAAHQQAAQPDAIQSIRVGHPGGHWQPAYHLAGRQGAAHRVERPNGSFLRKAPSRGARWVRIQEPLLVRSVLLDHPHIHGKMHFSCMSTCQIVLRSARPLRALPPCTIPAVPGGTLTRVTRHAIADTALKI